MHRVMLIGAAGACSLRNYVPTISWLINQGLPISIAAAVDLESRRLNLVRLFSNTPLQAQQTICIPDDQRDRETLSPETIRLLDQAVATGSIDTVIIATEPKSHMAYLQWAISRGLKILVEKPLCAPIDASIRPEAANQILANVASIDRWLRDHPLARLHVMAQRRYHTGYEFVLRLLRECLQKFQIPISFVDAFYSDGEWTFPDEYGRENHPFHYGYGILHHGGYHFADLISQIVSINDCLPAKTPGFVEVYSHSRRPLDTQFTFTHRDYARIFPGGPRTPRQIQTDRPAESLGECDVFSSCAFRRGPRLITSASLNLLHHGVSRRAWRRADPDTYKRNGRIRQECVRIDIGPLMSIEVRSYEAHETEKVFGPSKLRGDVGWPRHFDVTVFRNSDVVGGDPCAVYRLGNEVPSDNAKSFVEQGRRLLIKDFLSSDDTRSSFASHLRTNTLLHLMALNLAREFQGQTPLSTSAWPAQ